MEESMSNPGIPQSDSIEELARFWEQHDLTDFEETLEVVSEPVFERESVVRVRLPYDEANLVKQAAASPWTARFRSDPPVDSRTGPHTVSQPNCQARGGGCR